MFKNLKKKVREESNNTSILSDEINDNNDSLENPKRTNSNHRRTSSNTHIKHDRQRAPSACSTISNETDKNEEKDIISKPDPSIIDNYAHIVKPWIDSKEEILQQKEDDIQNLTEQTSNLQIELSVLRNKLVELDTSTRKNASDNAVKAPYLQKQIDTLRSENENLKTTIKTLRTQLNDVEAERDDLLIKSTDVTHSNNTAEFQKQRTENEQQKIELEHLRQVIIERDSIIEQQDKRLLIEHNTQAIQTDEDTSFVQVFAEPDVDTISKLQAELDDQNRTIKVLQQRYNDLRKTLQREFHASLPKDLNQMGSSKPNNNTPSSQTNHPLIHYDESTASQSDIDAAKRASTARQMSVTRKSVTLTNTMTEAGPAILPHTTIESTKSQKNGQAPLDNTNFKYLKHVILKFMTSTEDEAIHLIRAVSTLLNFSSDEERLLRETLDYKMSWFGKVTRPKPL